MLLTNHALEDLTAQKTDIQHGFCKKSEKAFVCCTPVSSLRVPDLSTPLLGCHLLLWSALTGDCADQVVATVIFPQDESPMTLPQAVEALFGQHFTSLTAAKKAIRRKELLVAGKVCNTTR